ncbi:hypothetical protein I118_1993 [Bifidobacterium longum D2957]|nr:hypothetical protein I118_1993 [Bifidobacterium longum D2957]
MLRILRRICHDSKPFNRHVRFHTRFIVHQCSEKHLCTHAIPNSAAPIGFGLPACAGWVSALLGSRATCAYPVTYCSCPHKQGGLPATTAGRRHVKKDSP